MTGSVKWCYIGFGLYMLALTTVTIAGFLLGYPQAAFVWVILLFAGFKCDRIEGDSDET